MEQIVIEMLYGGVVLVGGVVDLWSCFSSTTTTTTNDALEDGYI